MNAISRFLMILCLVLSTSSAWGQDTETPQDPRLKQIYRSVRILLTRHYPNASSHLLHNEIHFEDNTRLFVIHVPNKLGEWQDPWVQRAPKKGGILGTIQRVDGRYAGAAMVPQRFDMHYYTVMLMAPYSQKHDCHLLARLYIPKHGSKPQFEQELSELVNAFESKLKK